MTEVEIGENNMSNIFDKYFEDEKKKHTIHAYQCDNCKKGMKVPKRSRKNRTNLCFRCVNNRDGLPEHFFCQGISAYTKKRCKKITMDDYCSQHKGQGESNGEN